MPWFPFHYWQIFSLSKRFQLIIISFQQWKNILPIPLASIISDEKSTVVGTAFPFLGKMSFSSLLSIFSFVFNFQMFNCDVLAWIYLDLPCLRSLGFLNLWGVFLLLNSGSFQSLLLWVLLQGLIAYSLLGIWWYEC